MKRNHAIRFVLFTAVAAMFVAGPASATWNWPPRPAPTPDECVVKAYAKNDSWNNDEFWRFKFEEAVCDDAFIKEITIDLRAGSDTDAYFDLSGGNASDKAFGPKIGKLDGLSSSDVKFTPKDGDSSKLTLTFKDGAFSVGDKIYFGADTDYLGNDNGGSVGDRRVGLSVTFGNGVSYSTSFYKYSSSKAAASVRAKDCCGGTVIPTPSAVGLGMLMLGSVAVRRRRSA